MFIAVQSPGTALDKPLPRDRWSASPAERMTLLCRANGVRVGLITNGEDWMLVNAPVGETSGYASWSARIWWQEPVTLKAFQSLLGVRRCFGPEDGTLPRLLERSLEFQEEVTNTLGEQVRRAVEVLVQSLGRADQDRNGELLKNVTASELYEGGLTVMMRLVFLLCAEERDLLLLGDPVYDQNYAISTLRGQLREDADHHGLEVLDRRHDAWSRLLSVFRAIYGGVEHESMRLPALGGSLFDPDRFPFLEGRSRGTTWREEGAVPLPIDNRTVLLLLTALQVLEQRGGARLLSYRGLNVEQIGHVYEGLLEYTVERVPEVTVALVGSQKVPHPTITLARLEELAKEGGQKAANQLADLTGRSTTTLKNALDRSGDERALLKLIHACGGDESLARRLVPFAELIRSDSWENMLVYRTGMFAITKGSDRRSTGTHYTPRSLTEPIVQYTLEPLVYVGPAEGWPKDKWHLKPAADILGLKVCDMACGSGAFLVEACRYLANRLVEAWASEEAAGHVLSVDGVAADKSDGHEPMPKAVADRLVIAKRYVTQSCIHGVDKNHLAVELAKLSLWLVTLAKNKPFGFLDHAIRCGDSLIGVHDIEQLRHFRVKPDADEPVLFKGPLEKAVNEAIELRTSIEGIRSNTAGDVASQKVLLKQAEDKMSWLRCASDLLIATEFWESNARQKKEKLRKAATVAAHYVDGGAADEFQDIAKRERRGETMFHWPLEFPEVIVKRTGFDAFVGNPPFLGGVRISEVFSENYNLHLTSLFPPASKKTDLCAYFLRRSAQLSRSSGTTGMLATNTISQGTTRKGGLAKLVHDGCHIIRAVSSFRWPGDAKVIAAYLVFSKREWKGDRVVDGVRCTYISDLLAPEESANTAVHALVSNSRRCFQGSSILGMGFFLTPGQADEFITSDPVNATVVKPVLGGQELNESPTFSAPRWIIDMGERDEVEAKTFKRPFAHLECHVMPERLKKDPKQYPRLTETWWKFWHSRGELYGGIDRLLLTRVLARARVSDHHMVAFLPVGWVYTEQLVVFLYDQWHDFTELQSTVHEIWTRRFASTLKTDVRYIPTDCYGTFPRATNSVTLGEIGKRYYEHRGEVHDPEKDRSLHSACCHACGFVAETSCERCNRYLDRALLVKTFECANAAFFDGVASDG